MKIRDAKQLYTAQRGSLWQKSQALSKRLQDQGRSGSPAQAFDRVELSRELERVNAQYDAVDKALAGITAMETKAFGDECTSQQAETEAKMAEELGKIMEVYRRVASGAKVPAKDLQKLMDYDMKLYALARQSAMIAQSDKEYKSLWEDEEKPREQKTLEEVAASTDISVPHPSVVAASAEVPSEEIV